MDFMDNSSIRTVEAFLNCGLKVGKEFLLLLELDGFNSSMSNQLELVSKLLTKANATDVEIANNIFDLFAPYYTQSPRAEYYIIIIKYFGK